MNVRQIAAAMAACLFAFSASAQVCGVDLRDWRQDHTAWGKETVAIDGQFTNDQAMHEATVESTNNARQCTPGSIRTRNVNGTKILSAVPIPLRDAEIQYSIEVTFTDTYFVPNPRSPAGWYGWANGVQINQEQNLRAKVGVFSRINSRVGRDS